MKTFKYFLIAVIAFFGFGCIDNIPDIEELPSAAVNFNYLVIDDTYQIDYYTGANIEFTNISALEGTATWDFGDGTATVTGDVVTHKYSLPGTYKVKLTVNEQSTVKPILIQDIVPIMSVAPVEGGITEVLTTPITIITELPNPEGLEEEYLWIFPAGTMDEDGNIITTSSAKDPGKLKFSNVGSQTVRLLVKLGGRQLEEGRVNVQVGYNEEVPTLYYAVKGGNIMALKLVATPPAGMRIAPFDMSISSGNRPLNILFNDTSLYILDCGRQFTYVDPRAGLGDGKISVMSKDGAKFETLLTNAGGDAYDDPYFGFIEGNNLFFTDRNTGIRSTTLNQRNKTFSSAEYPYFVQNQALGYYNNGMSWGSISAGIGKIDGVWYWCKTYNGTGIFRFEDGDVLKSTITGGQPQPKAGIALSGMSPKSFVWDETNQVIYFTIYDTGFEGLYRCTIEELNGIGATKSNLRPYQLKTAKGKTVTPITEPGRDEGSSGEFLGITQLALDKATGDVYFGLRSGDPEVKSGLMRYNASKKVIEHVVEGVEVYGVAVNNTKTKLF